MSLLFSKVTFTEFTKVAEKCLTESGKMIKLIIMHGISGLFYLTEADITRLGQTHFVKTKFMGHLA